MTETVQVTHDAPELRVNISCGTRGGGHSFNLIGAAKSFGALWKQAVVRGNDMLKFSEFPVTDIDLTDVIEENKDKPYFVQVAAEIENMQLSFHLTADKGEMDKEWEKAEKRLKQFIKMV